jgi:hypothetical protein
VSVHKREARFEVKNCDTMRKLRIVVFWRDAELRRHTIKHLFEDREWMAWDAIYHDESYTLEKMRKKREELIEMDCPYFKGMSGRGTPPCGDFCDHFPEECDRKVSGWDEHYINLIKMVITRSIGHPLFARKKTTQSGKEVQWMDFLLPGNYGVRVCAIGYIDDRAQELPEYFNIATAYRNDLTPYEIYMKNMDKRYKETTFCTLKTWNLNRYGDWRDTLKGLYGDITK